MLKTILVALDGSETAERVIQALGDLVLSSNTKVILCHVFPTPESEIELPADRPHPESPKFSYFQIEKQMQFYQEKLSSESELELVTGDPAEEIVRLANIYNADLVVIGSRGLTGMKRIVQGSVSTQVMEEANCSVLVVKPGK
ncbi:universal stress protein [Anabaena cylindrica FACHB-243]|uniref:UspA domain-containing protein n=1 Tax=Anabaena cylindrica (strain ATCC 27899 / PCC 7122) TaxID=272123 RepID=K9ZI68_ANACC|nr:MULTISPECIES: universal stress protein [Anabaena]AFZ58040.1 UspA domain-containing protein [Anabaena cylindrica PCC 7122]MBD2419185.1 universal stress protein [Anabaena cylindrica FACHB-243]MBY5283994.1 universal stress protein [Anabaena sp. CCAP 1446/1C]MBY5306869.1 universal stress protein [Anabaena sp. CCAP 1446/1C]MCM2409657.1 universal stress protein [Anabaena sp. CCAP 1446/1C]